jgi:hypothetical protein
MEFIKSRERETKGAWRAQVESTHRQRECAFLFHVLLKSTLTHREGRPKRFPPNNEQVGRGMGSQVLVA